MSSEATSNAACPLTWGDTDWVLLADHGAYLPARDTLLVADTHFGKASIFAQAGIPAPAGVLRGTLERIDRMLAASGAGTLIILGDLWHGRLTEDDPCPRGAGGVATATTGIDHPRGTGQSRSRQRRRQRGPRHGNE
jgi:hypothetical protein